ncbi:MAG: hypothetical protein U0228_15935 [Myxococcaceae bacterium]
MAGDKTPDPLRVMVRDALRRVATPNELAARVGHSLPAPVRKLMLGRALDGLHLALCLHRVLPAPRPTDWQPGLSIPSDVLCAFLDELLGARTGPARGWLTVTFDDGYADAGAWLREHAPRFPDVEFLFFVCPQKSELRTGFRWDLVEERLKAGVARETALEEAAQVPPDGHAENARDDLKALPSLPTYALSSLEELRALHTLPNVKLGNHTNLHLSGEKFPDAVVEADYQQSRADFERLFGPMTQFAFPYGTPKHHFSARHVGWLRAQGDFPIWTTEARPFRAAERQRTSPVLPRFPIDGTLDAASLAGFIAARSIDFRVRGTPHRYE